MNASNAINTYNKVGLESGVAAADPHKLILMLYQGALLAIASAKNQMLRKEIAAKGVSISKAIAIIDEGLKCSLDMNVGGELAQNLAALYDYMCQRLLLATLKNDPSILDEVSRLLTEIRDAWESIRPEIQAATAANTKSSILHTSVATRNSTAPQTAAGKQAALMYGRM